MKTRIVLNDRRCILDDGEKENIAVMQWSKMKSVNKNYHDLIYTGKNVPYEFIEVLGKKRCIQKLTIQCDEKEMKRLKKAEYFADLQRVGTTFQILDNEKTKETNEEDFLSR